MSKNILIITGGTGGHVIPAVNFFNYLLNNGNRVYLLTDYRGSQYINSVNENKIFKIYSSHFSGNLFFKLKALIKLVIGAIQSLIIFIKLKPKTIISFGSYASSTPLVCFLLFKFFFKTSLYIHEQNSVVGKVNKAFIRFSNQIFMNFEKEYFNIKKYKNKISIVGLPQKINSNNLNNNENNNTIFNFLVFAGSQGSFEILFILEDIIKNMKKNLNSKEIFFTIQAPLVKHKEIENLLKNNGYNFKIQNFFNNFDKILKQTDIALCRSGAGTINDLINFKIPAIICPLSTAKDNHQYENAKILSGIHCAIIVNKNKINNNEIILFIDKLINDKNYKKNLKENFKKIEIRNTNELMWNLIKNEK
jgi:UDP-N-acetylglucosamine--N-acetylmuramyl-(pentapeptide) pyrophosphoryl-undecaprenol N-acetylglucosamine transferase